MTFRDSGKVVGTLRVPSATLVTAHGVCLLLCASHNREMSFSLGVRGQVQPTSSVSKLAPFKVRDTTQPDRHSQSRHDRHPRPLGARQTPLSELPPRESPTPN